MTTAEIKAYLKKKRNPTICASDFLNLLLQEEKRLEEKLRMIQYKLYQVRTHKQHASLNQ